MEAFRQTSMVNCRIYNTLYWDFFLRHQDLLSGNPRIGMAYQQLRRMPADEQAGLRAQAARTLRRIEEL
jgi:deoxyribodipyrimidine photolyase-related protein